MDKKLKFNERNKHLEGEFLFNGIFKKCVKKKKKERLLCLSALAFGMGEKVDRT